MSSMSSESISRLITARAALPPTSSLPLGLVLGSCDPGGGPPKGGKTLHALLWAPLASLSSDPVLEDGAAAASFLQQLQQQQQHVADRLVRQALLCCSHHLIGGLAVLGVWARVPAAAGQQQLEQQQQTLQRQMQATRLAAAVAQGPLEGLNASDEAAAAALLQRPEKGSKSQQEPWRQPFVFVLLQQQQQQQDAGVSFSALTGGSTWSPLAAASVLPLQPSAAPKQQQHKQQQQQQRLQLCCSPISVDLTLTLDASLLKSKASSRSSAAPSSAAATAAAAAERLETASLRAALRRALREVAGLVFEGPSEEGAPGGNCSCPPFYCVGRNLTEEPGRGAPRQEAGHAGALCNADMTVAAAAAAAAGEGAQEVEVLEVELLSASVPSVAFFVTERSIAAAAPFSMEQQQELLPQGFAAVRCRLALPAFAVVPEGHKLRSAMEALIADWVRGAVRCIGSSLEAACSPAEERGKAPLAAAVSMQQRRLLVQRREAALLEQQQAVHGAAAALAELAGADEGEAEGCERVRLEFLFGAEGAWRPVLLSYSGPCLGSATLFSLSGLQDRGGDAAARKACQVYWKDLISSLPLRMVEELRHQQEQQQLRRLLLMLLHGRLLLPQPYVACSPRLPPDCYSACSSRGSSHLGSSEGLRKRSCLDKHLVQGDDANRAGVAVHSCRCRGAARTARLSQLTRAAWCPCSASAFAAPLS
ncbi:hypothetical protein Esti_002553 [Eimeria stiedai]